MAAASILSLLVHAGGIAWFSVVASSPFAAGAKAGPPPSLTVPSDLWPLNAKPETKPDTKPDPTLPIPPEQSKTPPREPLPTPEVVPPPTVSPRPEPVPIPRPEPDEVRPGIDESEADTKAWKGYSSGTPQHALKADQDQAALSRAPGVPAPASTPAPAAQETLAGPVSDSASESTDQSAPQEPEAAPTQPPNEPDAEPEESESPAVTPPVSVTPEPIPAADKSKAEAVPDDSEPSIRPERITPSEAMQPPSPESRVEPVDATSREELTHNANPSSMTPAGSPQPVAIGDEAPVSPATTPVTPTPSAHATAPAAPPPVAPRTLADVPDLNPFASLMRIVRPRPIPASSSLARASAPPAPPPAADGDRPGEQSDSDSDPFSEVVRIGPVELGRPVAAKGLQISTVRPRWSHTVTLLSNPTDPVVRLAFDNRGVCVDVQFVDGQNTGSEEVDGPLVAALYAWRARGEALTKLTDSPDSTLRMTFRLSLR